MFWAIRGFCELLAMWLWQGFVKPSVTGQEKESRQEGYGAKGIRSIYATQTRFEVQICNITD